MKNPLIFSGFLILLAEREGFEPPAPLSAAVFKTAVIDHSTISPEGDKISASRMQKACFLLRRSLISQTIFPKSDAKVRLFLVISKFLGNFLQENSFMPSFAALIIETSVQRPSALAAHGLSGLPHRQSPHPERHR